MGVGRTLQPLGAWEFGDICRRLDDGNADRADKKAATKHLLALLVQRVPGASVEVRIPPFAVVQCIEGARHTRGTPPAVVEMDAETWIAVARGRLAWSDGVIRASGERSDLAWLMPLTDT